MTCLTVTVMDPSLPEPPQPQLMRRRSSIAPATAKRLGFPVDGLLSPPTWALQDHFALEQIAAASVLDSATCYMSENLSDKGLP
jgi:hypothetical protein